MSHSTYSSRGLAVSLGPDVNAPAAARAALGRLSGLDPDAREKLTLLVSELVTNSVLHGRLTAKSRITLTVSVGDVVAVAVSDPGCGFTDAAIGPRREHEGGWGLHLVERLAGRWGIDHGPPTRVWFELDHALAGAERRRANWA
jgi:anti-sigma regulatory factor (Ser/Thr protein kinase)